MTYFRPHSVPTRFLDQEVGRTIGLALVLLLVSVSASGQTSDSSKGKVEDGYAIRQSIDLGGRIADTSGSGAMYDTLVNMQSGPRILNQSLDARAIGNTGHLFFDSLSTTSSGYGGDPYDVTTFRMSKGKLYNFQGLFRRDREYFDYNLLDNPLVPAGVVSNGYTFPQVLNSPHLFNTVRRMADEALRELKPCFDKLYAKTGRPSIAPEKLLRALLLQVLYSVRSERMLMEQLNYNLLFRWFVGLNMDDAIWDATVFSKNRQRLLAGDIAEAFFESVLKQARRRDLLSDEHFTVDGTLLEAWAGQKSFRRIDDDQQPPAASREEGGSNPIVNFHGEKRSNDTHFSTTDPDAMQARKSRGSAAVLAYRGHLLTENRNGLVVSTRPTQAYGAAERDAALLMIEDIPGNSRVTLGADKGTHARVLPVLPRIFARGFILRTGLESKPPSGP